MHHPAITFVAPFRIYVPDYFFDVRMPSWAAQVKALPLPTVQAEGASQVHGANVEIAHDIFGFAGRTKFFVVLDQVIDVQNPDWKAVVCDADRTIVDDALQAVNRLLAVYRDRDVDGTGLESFHILELVRGDLSDIRLVVVDRALQQYSDLAINWPGYQRMGFGQTVVRSDAAIARMAHDLANNSPIPIERELLSSARNHFWRGPLRLVPLEANTAFEAFAFAALRTADPLTTISDTSDIYGKLVALHSALLAAGSTRTLGLPPWFDVAVPGWKGLLCQELLAWHSDCYQLRNKVIHRGYNSLTNAETRSALQASERAIAFLQSFLDSIP